MTDSRKIAGLLGPVIMVMTATEYRNFDIWTISNPALIYLDGMILFTCGLAIIRAHPKWRMDWSLLVTAAGWFALLLGLYRAIWPRAEQAPASLSSYVGVGLLFLCGAVMTFKAYFGKDNQASV